MIELDISRAPFLAPSILSADHLAIASSIEGIGEVDILHVDIMDGHFVPNLSYGPAIVRALKKRFPKTVIDVHVMASPADMFVDMFISAGPDVLTFHAEATDHIYRILHQVKSAGIMAGVSIDPGTPLCMIDPILHAADLVLIMSVEPGFGGQKFITESLKKIKDLVRAREAERYHYLIEIDGGVNFDNARMIAEAGADIIVAGNAVFAAADPSLAAAELKKLIGRKGDR